MNRKERVMEYTKEQLQSILDEHIMDMLMEMVGAKEIDDNKGE